MKNRNEFEKETKQYCRVLNSATSIDLVINHYGFEKTTATKELVTSKELPLFRLHFIEKGKLFLNIGNNSLKLGKNSYFLLMPQKDMSYQTDPKNPAIFYWVAFKGSLAAEYIKTMGILDEKPFGLLNKKHCYEACNSIYKALTSDEQTSCDLFFFYQIFYSLCNSIFISTQNNNQTKHKTYKPHNYVNIAIDYINQNFSDPNLSVRDIADKIGLHVNYFSTIFKQQTNLTFSQYLTSKRIEIALSLINEGMTSISEISEKVGFKDPFYFSSVFKKYNLVSPSEHIKKVQNKSVKE